MVLFQHLIFLYQVEIIIRNMQEIEIIIRNMQEIDSYI